MNEEFDNDPLDQDDASDPRDPGLVYPQRLSSSKQGMLSTQHYAATRAGSRLFAEGGNAVDAAVAAAFALGVCEPAACGLGGQTMIMLYDAASGRKIALDGSSRAPHRVPPGALKKSARRRGHRATTVPSTPAVLAYTLQRYGSKTLAEVLQPAIAIAEEGFAVSPLLHFLMRRELKRLQAGTAGQFFLDEQKEALAVGALLRQPVLANTLRRLAEAGVEDFYQGEIAAKIHADMQANNGLIQADDLAQIPWPVERRPLTTRFMGQRVFTFGPPGAGRILIEVLNVLSELPERLRNPDSLKGALTLAELIQRANQDRADRPFHPNLYSQELELGEKMLKPAYAKRVAKRLRARIRGHGETTHLSAMDAQGNAVALTQSIERVFGSFAAAPDLGFIYNNYMSAFDTEDMSHPYYLRPNAAPWASVAPTLVFRGTQPWLAIGSPGSERIVSAVVQVLLRLLREESAFDAVDAPRLHCSITGKVSLEAARMRDDLPELLRQRGFEVDIRDPYSFYLGCVQLVMRSKRGLLTGVADPRRDGSAAGPLL